ncbi:hypothetical protein, unlikely [Trypanosoma brucei gambiense DAL972]|uniref:Uncharacterized protein n=1 Tax=Trypanosoma brucei gambiense (strain MHOM/CI/86/DAL972) TaxID=679716 RepID=C9ZT26_TRYB9|nr:hypothetical protein, unlikely [Trypanosoma brucei gambiense DAL972]CBH12561.1 hypothetical protein, unlikely [Trypanosoma brucei gambiense DAL972]|eukprot:XP_011774841.1 hypothetical protein, unlikely [Trypanosoma brucei gambiense DAL972]
MKQKAKKEWSKLQIHKNSEYVRKHMGNKKILWGCCDPRADIRNKEIRGSTNKIVAPAPPKPVAVPCAQIRPCSSGNSEREHCPDLKMSIQAPEVKPMLWRKLLG